MDTTIIIYVVIAFVVGVIITLIFKKSYNSEDSGNDSKIHELESENDSLKEKLDTIFNESKDKESQLKEKYENLLSEAKEQSESLDRQLKVAIEGNIDEVVKEQISQVEKLKKKIKELEEDIEEYEDDIEDLKKKIRTKDESFAELQDDLSKERSSAKRLQEELSTVRQQLDDKVEELNIKIGSLNFIQEILSAKETSTEDTRTLNRNIDYFESFVKGQFTDVSSYLFSERIIPDIDMAGETDFSRNKKVLYDAFDQWASTKRKSWLDGKTTIAFVGEFSAGKTSIVNRILSQDDPSIPKLPVSTKATTAIPTYIAGGSIVSYSFISGDGKRKTILEETFKKVSKEVLDQVKGISSLVKYFVMTYKNPNLNGLSVLDTPGFNSNDKEDKDRTIDVINECDALFWVFDVNAGTVNRSSISIIKEKLNKPLYIVINKVDTKSSSEVQKVEQLIKRTLSDEGLTVEKFIRFSSKSPLTDIMNPIKEVKKIASRDTFVDDVKVVIEHYLKSLDNSVKRHNENYNRVRRDGEHINYEIEDCMNNLKNDCQEASEIPKWSKGFKIMGIGTDDKYVMTPDERNRLKNMLEQIEEERIKDLKTKFHKSIKKAKEIEKEWSELSDLKTTWQKVNDCYEQYKKISKNLS